jgi:hypothetical protein
VGRRLAIAALVLALVIYAGLFFFFGGWWVFCFVPGVEC